MASLFTHAVSGLALASPFVGTGSPRRLFVLAPLAACLPDFDFVAFRFGIPYSHPLGHRGFSHSILFAGLMASGMFFSFFDTEARRTSGRTLIPALFLAGLSHGLLDALTDGGLGVGFLVPFWNGRFFFPARPLAVSPLRVRAFFTLHGWMILRSEMAWVWLPSAALAAGSWVAARLRVGRASSAV